MMYDELVKKLREKADCFDYDGRPDIACDYEQAADAIEELLPFKKQVEKGMGLLDKADELLEAVKPRWIPVTERLPEEDPVGSMVLCVLTKRKRGFRWIDLRLFMDGEFHHPKHQKGQVTHWMPLPEPPKEETE